MRAVSAAALLILLAGAALAHPHSQTDQQVMLSLGLARADLALAIVPGTKDGPALVVHLDRDGDGSVSGPEADAFGADVLAAVTLSVDGAPVPLSSVGLQVPPAKALAAGTAGLRLKLTGDIALSSAGQHRVDLTVTHGEFGDWFIQPYFHPDFASGVTATQIERPAPGQLRILLQTKGEGA